MNTMEDILDNEAFQEGLLIELEAVLRDFKEVLLYSPRDDEQTQEEAILALGGELYLDTIESIYAQRIWDKIIYEKFGCAEEDFNNGVYED